MKRVLLTFVAAFAVFSAANVACSKTKNEPAEEPEENNSDDGDTTSSSGSSGLTSTSAASATSAAAATAGTTQTTQCEKPGDDVVPNDANEQALRDCCTKFKYGDACQTKDCWAPGLVAMFQAKLANGCN